ncbi:1434_t:CDS:2, partial [Racocetra persica]
MSSLNNSTHEILERNTSNEPNNITEDNIQRYIKNSKIKNTDACTQKWVRSLQEYHMKCQDGKPYKPESIVSAYTSLRRYLFEGSAIKNININDRFQFPILYRVVDGKIMELQDQGLGEIDQSKVFFWNAYLLGLRGGYHYRLLLNCFDFQPDGNLIFMIGREKNNQGGLKGRSKYGRFTSRRIHIPADQSDNEFKPIQDLCNYINLRPSDACEYFYLQLTRNIQKINNRSWFKEFQVMQHEEFQITQQEVQVIQHKEFQTTQHITQDNSSVMQQEVNATNIQIKSQPFRIPFKNVQDQTQHIEMTKDGITNIFEFHNSGNVKI